MAIPRFMRPVVRFTVNPVTRLFAGRLGGFGIMHATGRTAGRRRSTPLDAFHRGGRWSFALTYGSTSFPGSCGPCSCSPGRTSSS
jgi:hypothetical protein